MNLYGHEAGTCDDDANTLLHVKTRKTDHASTHIKTIAVHRNRRMHKVFIKSNLTENVARTKSVIGRTEQQRHANRMMCRVPLAVEEWMSTRGDETVSGC
jgi:hypothetical protein